MNDRQGNKGFLPAGLLAAAPARPLRGEAGLRERGSLRRRKSGGFTMAEALVALGIIAVLLAIGLVGVTRYRRGMKQMELDNVAEEIFISAQNHLTLAKSQGYLDKTDKGWTPTDDPDDPEYGIYYFFVGVDADDPSKGAYTSPASEAAKGTLLSLMLPMGSVDELVQLGGSFVIRYQPDTATILDVFYAEKSDSFSYRFSPDDYLNGGPVDPEGDSPLYGDDNGRKSDRRNYNGAVIGWYGGAGAKVNVPALSALSAPLLIVHNEETLWVELLDYNVGLKDNKDQSVILNWNLTIQGLSELSGGNSRLVKLDRGKAEPVYKTGGHELDCYRHVYVLDDITRDTSKSENPHDPQDTGNDRTFYHQFCGQNDGKDLIPGENIRLQAVVDTTGILFSSIEDGKSNEAVTNSLFAEGSSKDGAKIAYFRHLENLDKGISNVNPAVFGEKAEQIRDLTWTGGFHGSPEMAANPNKPYTPVSPGYPLAYDGGGRTIAGLEVTQTDGNDCAGVFGELSASAVSDLKLSDVKVTVAGAAEAGALAGAVIGSDITNVLAVTSSATFSVTGSGDVGGLIGRVEDSEIRECAAALVVSGGTHTGGLIGYAVGTTLVERCCSGGRTENGRYIAYNVTGSGDVGGLIGYFKGVGIGYSYSTCSTQGTIAGGLAGKAESGNLSHCYATGLVQGSANEGAFLGLRGTSSTVDVSDCQYFMIVNERAKDAGGGAAGYRYLAPVGGEGSADGITALDDDPETYDGFMGGGKTAHPYDISLGRAYPLKTVVQLANLSESDSFVADHWGDWPTPEKLFVNQKG